MSSSWPVVRFGSRGRAKALTAGVTELVKFSVNAPDVTLIKFARLTSMPRPPLALIVCEVVVVDVKGPENEATQTAPAKHGWLKPVTAAPVPL